MDCGSYSKPVVKLLLKHCERIFIRAEKSPSLRAQLDAPQVWRKTEINHIEVETTFIFYAVFCGPHKEQILIAKVLDIALNPKRIAATGGKHHQH